jgi:hypothetical protein
MKVVIQTAGGRQLEFRDHGSDEYDLTITEQDGTKVLGVIVSKDSIRRLAKAS